VDFGGRDVVTFAELLRRLRIARGAAAGPALPVPLAPVVVGLAMLERPFFDLLPATAGQFYAFRHDGVALPDPGVDPPPAARRGVDEFVAEVRARAEAPPSPADRLARLDRECHVFSRYLVGAPPGDAIRAHYRRAHLEAAHPPVPAHAPDDALVAFARRGPAAARLADTWAALFDRGGPLRCKLVLLLAMFESVGDTSSRVDGPTASSRPAFLAGAAVRGLGFLLRLPVAALLVGGRRRRVRRPGEDGA
ncbi:MAG TPA: hypothetical protein VKU85_18365, partial [bacterium]|nr:hypothetical protein [bacterium]